MLKYKVAQNFPKIAQKVTSAVYTWKWMFSKQPNNSTYIWATFVRKSVNMNFKISPILVTLLSSQVPEREREYVGRYAFMINQLVEKWKSTFEMREILPTLDYLSITFLVLIRLLSSKQMTRTRSYTEFFSEKISYDHFKGFYLAVRIFWPIRGLTMSVA